MQVTSKRYRTGSATPFVHALSQLCTTPLAQPFPSRTIAQRHAFNCLSKSGVERCESSPSRNPPPLNTRTTPIGPEGSFPPTLPSNLQHNCARNSRFRPLRRRRRKLKTETYSAFLHGPGVPRQPHSGDLTRARSHLWNNMLHVKNR
jgi:hypothetical protein